MPVAKAAAMQLSPVPCSREGTVAKVVRKLHELGERGVQVATLTKTVVPYYPYFSFVQSTVRIITGREHLRRLGQAVTVPSAVSDALGEAGRHADVAVSIGINERDGGSDPFCPNTPAQHF